MAVAGRIFLCEYFDKVSIVTEVDGWMQRCEGHSKGHRRAEKTENRKSQHQQHLVPE